jgi:FSR family fosmidomycin resistance protein-like MFS transporter
MERDTNARAETRAHTRDLALLSAAHAVTHVQPVLYPLIYPAAMAALHFGYAQIGLLVGVTNLVAGVLQGVYGWLFQWLRRRSLGGGGNILLGIATALSGLAGSFPAFFGLRILASVASSPQHPVASSLLSDWYPRGKRGAPFAVHFSGGNIATVVTPLLVGLLLARVGWRETLIVLGAPGVVVGALFWSLADDTPALGASWFHQDAPGHSPYRLALRRHDLLALILVRIVTSGGRGLGVILTYVPLYLVADLRLAPATASLYVALLAAGSVVAPTLAGRLADQIGRRRPMIVASLWVSAVATLWLLHVTGRSLGLLAALIVLGLAVYNESPLMQALLADLVTDEERDGAFGLFFVTSFVSGAVWGFLLGIVVARWHFQAAFMLMAASYLLGSGLLGLVPEPRATRPAALPTRRTSS